MSVILASCASFRAIYFLNSCCFYFSSRLRFFLLCDRLLRSLLRLREPLLGLPFFSLSSYMLTFRPFTVCTEEGILTLPILPRDRVLSSSLVGVAVSFPFEEDFFRWTVATEARLLLNVTLPKL